LYQDDSGGGDCFVSSSTRLIFSPNSLMKERIISQHRWDLNICCDKTDAGGINADIIRHAQIPNFVLIKDIYNLPLADHIHKCIGQRFKA
jgi:hypothetical protein